MIGDRGHQIRPQDGELPEGIQAGKPVSRRLSSTGFGLTLPIPRGDVLLGPDGCEGRAEFLRPGPKV